MLLAVGKAKVEREGVHEYGLRISCLCLLKMQWKYFIGERVRINCVDIWTQGLFELSQLPEKCVIYLKVMNETE